MQFETVQIKNISKDDQFCLSFGRDIKPLEKSIRACPVINPPVLIENNEHLIIISGFRRIQCLINLGIKEVASKIYSCNELDQASCLKMSFLDNLTSRGFNEMEKAIVLKKFKELSPAQLSEIAKELTITDKLIPHYIKLCDLEDEMKISIARADLHPQIGILLSDLKTGYRKNVFDLLKNLKPTLQEGKEIITLLEETSQKYNITISSMLKDGNLKSLNTLNVREILRSKRYPVMTEKIRSFENTLKSSRLGTIKIQPPKFFEGNHLEFSFKAKNIIDFKMKLETIKESLDSGHIGALFSILKEARDGI